MEYKEYAAEVSAKIGIVDVIGHYVKLHRQGRNYVGLCPFHHEKTPSFTVSPDKNLFYCFGCKASGDMLTFVRRIHNVSLPEAVDIVSREFQVELPPWHMSTAASRDRQQLLEAMKVAAAGFAAALRTDGASQCRDYMKDRGLVDDIVQRFGLGYCPSSAASLIQWCAGRGVSVDVLTRTGVVQQHGSEVTSPFSHRLVFPIWDSVGNVVAFGGRAIDGSMPKYINSPETALFSKRRTLYGLPLAEPSIRETGFAIVVEGYMDAIALHASGFTNAVASLGTAFTEEQGNLLKRSTSRVLLNFDSDTAGQHAALAALAVADRTGIDVAIVRVQGAKDPDELLQQPDGRARYQAALDQAVAVDDFLLDVSSSGKDLSSATGQRAFVQEVMETVDDMRDSLLRTQLLSKMALRIHVREEELVGLYRKGRRAAPRQPVVDPWQLPRKTLGHSRIPTGESLRSARSALEQDLVHGLVHNLDHCPELLPALDGVALQDETYREILEVIRREGLSGTLQPATLVAELSPAAGSLVGKWAFEEHKLTYAGIMDIAGRLKSGSPGFMDASTVARH
ncbi:MAG TPA: DNA primase [Candidatus Cryosericum sp.]|nr:DNA primase [Candidatus Cryosericum sp.]